jgi:carboxyl-terminal processing protease
MRRRHFIWAGTMLAITGCADAGPSEPEYVLDPVAEAYLAEALDILENNSVKKHDIDWVVFRDAAFRQAKGAGSPAETYPAIVAALERLGDNHSFFTPPDGNLPSGDPFNAPQRAGSSSDAAIGAPGSEDPVARLLPSGFGYVLVPPFSGGADQANELVAKYHQLVADVDAAGSVCGWVVDVRGNTGGNMWPMVAGVAPLLGEGTVGHFIDADGRASDWFIEEGRVGVEDFVLVEAPSPTELARPFAAVAVLTDRRTASAGEAVAIAFRGRPMSRSFGEPTWGVSTANSAFPLSDGAVIVLTVATMADRLGNTYGGEVVPDVMVPMEDRAGTPGSDAALAAATSWLRAQPCS